MKKYYQLIVCAAAMLNSPLYHANGSMLQGVYLEGNLGYSYVREEVINSGNNNNDGVGWNANLGYQVDRNWAVEGGFTEHTNETMGAGPRPTRGTENYVVDAAVKGSYPLQRNVNVFAKLGPAYVHHKLKNAGTRSGSHARLAAYGGVGAEVSVRKKLALTVQINGNSKGGLVPAMIITSVGLKVIV